LLSSIVANSWPIAKARYFKAESCVKAPFAHNQISIATAAELSYLFDNETFKFLFFWMKKAWMQLQEGPF